MKLIRSIIVEYFENEDYAKKEFSDIWFYIESTLNENLISTFFEF